MTGTPPTASPPRVVTGALPPTARAALDAAGLNHRPVIVTVDTDVSLDGEPRREWLFVTPDHLSVVGEGAPSTGDAAERPPAAAGNDTGRVLRVVPWQDVAQVRTTAGVGAVHVDGLLPR